MSASLDVVEMYFTACKFSECADLCQHEGEKKGVLGVLYATPAVVNAAFACEVFLKLLLHSEEIEIPREHRLQALYNKLPDELKERIRGDVVRRCGQWKDAFGMECLKSVSDAFATWRYNYEHDWHKSVTLRIDIAFLMALKSALNVLCDETMRKKMNFPGEEAL